MPVLPGLIFTRWQNLTTTTLNGWSMMQALCGIAARSSRQSTTPTGRWKWWSRKARWENGFWSFEPGPEDRPKVCDQATLMTLGKTEVSTKISKELKKRGWSFVGPTTVYAFMQAMGIVNDHLEGCFCRDKIEVARGRFTRP